MKTYNGLCHCGAVQFKIQSNIEELTTCDCSICVKKNALMTKVHEDAFELTAGEEHLSEYRWNMQIARHFFCKTCGIYTFHRKRAQPDHYGINVYCLEDFNVSNFPVRATEGENMTVKQGDDHPSWPGPRI